MGPAGPPGGSGLVTYVSAERVTINPDGAFNEVVECRRTFGEPIDYSASALSGGWVLRVGPVFAGRDPTVIRNSYAFIGSDEEPLGWHVAGVDGTPGADVIVLAVCAVNGQNVVTD